jgi:hypothetical protein
VRDNGLQGFLGRRASLSLPAIPGDFTKNAAPDTSVARALDLVELIGQKYPDLNGVVQSDLTYYEVKFKTDNPVWPTIHVKEILIHGAMMDINVFGEDGKVVVDGKPWTTQSFGVPATLTCTSTYR